MMAPGWKLVIAVLSTALGVCACSTTVPSDGGRSGDATGELSIVIEGNAALSRRELERYAADALIVLDRDRREYQADDAAFTMEEYCREQGYYLARVNYEFEAGPPARVVFSITEGPRAVLGNIALKGRGAAESMTLTQFFTGPETSWVGGSTIFVQSRVEDAARLIRAWFRSEGFLTVEVDTPQVTFREKGTIADVEVVIRPGPQFTIRALRFEVDVDFQERALVDALERPRGSSFTNVWVSRAEKKVYAFFRKRGYIDPQVSAEVHADRATGNVVIHFTVQAGEKRKVGKIVFEGNERTEESFLRSLVVVEGGVLFDGDRLQQTMSRLYATALFDRVTVETIPRSGGVVDIVFVVTERDPRDVAFLAGYGSYELLRGSIVFTDRNLFGRGLKWSSGLKGSFKGARLETSLTDPFFLDLPLAGTVEVHTEQREFPAFLLSDYGLVAAVTKDWDRDLQSTLGYSYEKSDADHVEPGFDLADLADKSSLGSVFTRWALDRRDSRISPAQGSLNEIKFEVADDSLGGTLDFNRISGRTAWLFSLDGTGRWVLAVGARAGVIVRRAETDVIPLQHRYFNGGADSVRSFREHKLGPQLQGDPAGGEFFSTANIELRTPLYERLGATLFADGGNVRLRRQDAGFDDYRYALGVGLRYDLPIGPVRLDWGWNPDRRSSEDLWALHLSVGFAF